MNDKEEQDKANTAEYKQQIYTFRLALTHGQRNLAINLAKKYGWSPDQVIDQLVGWLHEGKLPRGK